MQSTAINIKETYKIILISSKGRGPCSVVVLMRVSISCMDIAEAAPCKTYKLELSPARSN